MDSAAEELMEKLETLEDDPFGIPFDPVQTLLDGLHHSEREIRVRAARLSGRFPVEEFIEPLFRLVAESRDLEVRKAGVDALGTFLHQGRMHDYHRSPPEDEDAGMSRLSRVQFQAVRDFLGELVNQDDWPASLRARALPHYAKLEPESAASTIEQFYRSGDTRLIEGALEALGRIDTGEWNQLIKQELVRDSYDQRRLAAVDAAGIHDVHEVGPELVGILEESPREEFRRAAAEALSLISWGDAAQHLENYADDEDELVRQYAREGLARWAHRQERDEPR